MNDNDPLADEIQELRGENEALRRVLLTVINGILTDEQRDALKGHLGASIVPGDVGNLRRGAYQQTMEWFVRHIDG